MQFGCSDIAEELLEPEGCNTEEEMKNAQPLSDDYAQIRSRVSTYRKNNFL
jgi:hypothetical protein